VGCPFHVVSLNIHLVDLCANICSSHPSIQVLVFLLSLFTILCLSDTLANNSGSPPNEKCIYHG
jgi:hypothetical protein